MKTCGIRNNQNDRAASETIGFVIVLGIIIGGIGLVTLYGYPMLLKQQSSADEQIMEKNLIVLQNDVKSLAYKTVPYKETSLKIGGGALTVYNMKPDTGKSYFSIYNESGGIQNDDGSSPLVFYPGDLRYESASAQTGMSLENGAVVKRVIAQEGSVMLAEPRWFYDSTTSTAVIYLIGFDTTEIMSRTGVGTVKMELDTSKTNSTTYEFPSGDKVYVSYKPPASPNPDYSAAWGNYFKNTLKLEGPDAGGYYRFPQGIQKLVITRYEIIIKSL
ncbi:MAG TPA: hypothetical protein PKM50_07075 [Methanoregula sp.]|nr:hypothetical protein [Methanoregula sp.]